MFLGRRLAPGICMSLLHDVVFLVSRLKIDWGRAFYSVIYRVRYAQHSTCVLPHMAGQKAIYEVQWPTDLSIWACENRISKGQDSRSFLALPHYVAYSTKST